MTTAWDIIVLTILPHQKQYNSKEEAEDERTSQVSVIHDCLISLLNRVQDCQCLGGSGVERERERVEDGGGKEGGGKGEKERWRRGRGGGGGGEMGGKKRELNQLHTCTSEVYVHHLKLNYHLYTHTQVLVRYLLFNEVKVDP